MNFLKVTLFLSVLMLSSINAWTPETEAQRNALQEYSASHISSESSSSSACDLQVPVDHASLQKALEHLRNELTQSGQISNNLNLAQQQIQLAALENLFKITEKLSKKDSSKKNDDKYIFKKLLDPLYVLDQTIKGAFHISGRVYDKCETALITVITYALVLKILFPGTLTAAQQAWNGLQVFDSFIGAVANDPLGSVKMLWMSTPAYQISNEFPTIASNIGITVGEYFVATVGILGDFFSTGAALY